MGNSSRRFWRDDFGTGCLSFAATSALVWLGITFGVAFVPSDKANPETIRTTTLEAVTRFDGKHYATIAERGYSYAPGERSMVAFFPVYPLEARGLVRLTGWEPRVALAIVSNLLLLGSFIAWSAYLRSRDPDERGSRGLALALLGLCPAGFFFRMTYSESTFLCFTLLVLCGMARHWPLPVLAVLTGLVTAVRPVGVAVAAALVWHVLAARERGPLPRRALLAAACLPLACWGLIAYMAYQYYAFGTPLAFAQTQENWAYLKPKPDDPWDKVESLLSAEPIWGVYTSDPVRAWDQLDPRGNFLFSMFFWNPIYFVAALALVLYGAHRGWLTGPEVVLGLGLLAIPYVTRAYEMSMASHARFAAVVVPAYLVLARILGDWPPWVTWCVLSWFAVMLFAWSALFAAGHVLF